MVSRQDQQQLVAAFLDQLHRGDADGGCRVATKRLEQQALDVQRAASCSLTMKRWSLLHTSKGCCIPVEGQALDSLLEQCLFASQCKELLGERLAGRATVGAATT